MKRMNKFDDNRNMSEMQMEQFQWELNVFAQKLHKKEQQLSHAVFEQEHSVPAEIVPFAFPTCFCCRRIYSCVS